MTPVALSCSKAQGSPWPFGCPKAAGWASVPAPGPRPGLYRGRIDGVVALAMAVGIAPCSQDGACEPSQLLWLADCWISGAREARRVACSSTVNRIIAGSRPGRSQQRAKNRTKAGASNHDDVSRPGFRSADNAGQSFAADGPARPKPWRRPPSASGPPGEASTRDSGRQDQPTVCC